MALQNNPWPVHAAPTSAGDDGRDVTARLRYALWQPTFVRLYSCVHACTYIILIVRLVVCLRVRVFGCCLIDFVRLFDYISLFCDLPVLLF